MSQDTLKNLYKVYVKTQKKLKALEEKINEPIAIIGMGCRFPGGANSPDEYWELLKAEKPVISHIPAERWDLNAFFDANKEAPGKMYTTLGGFIEQSIRDFDAAFFSISNKEASHLDPQQRLLLEVSWDTIEDAKQSLNSLSGSKTGVFVGISNDEYSRAHRNCGSLDKISPYSLTGTTQSTSSGRLSYFYDVHGPSVTMDTACSSSLVALHLACQSIRSGDSAMALVGGVNLIMTPSIHVCFSKLKALSEDGFCKTFDASANGYSRGEGCGFVFLKKLSDALADQDSIHALVRGSAINQDGKSNGLTSPNGAAQEKVIEEALANAGLGSGDIDYLEAHGTGTKLGDPIEVEAIGSILLKGEARTRPLHIGSVKTFFGHLEAASGMASLIKVVLGLRYKSIPGSLHLKKPNPLIDWERYPIKTVGELMDWEPVEGQPRRAALSAFGFSGTNANIIVEEYCPEEKPEEEISPQPLLLNLSAKTEDALREMVLKYKERLASLDPALFSHFCYTAVSKRTLFPFRFSARGNNPQELMAGLDPSKIASSQQNVNGTVFLFTGQGSQYKQMGAELYESMPLFRKEIDHCNELLANYLDRSLLDLLYGDEDEALLDRTRYTQPLLFCLQYALCRLWEAWGVRPNAVLGHSVGEYAAACVAGVFSLEEGIKLITARARLMDALPEGGGMTVFSTSQDKVRELMSELGLDLAIAALNGPRNTVVSGDLQALQSLATLAVEQKIRTNDLPVSHAYHSELMEPILDEFLDVASQINFKRPNLDFYSNLTGDIVDEEVTTARYWSDHLRSTVLFHESMLRLSESGPWAYLEIGPKPILSGMAKPWIREGLFLPSLRSGKSDRQQMLNSLSALFVAQAPVDWASAEPELFGVTAPDTYVSLPTYPFQRMSYWMDPINTNGDELQRVHPLIDKVMKSSLIDTTLYEATLARNVRPFLAEHIIYDFMVVSGATYVSMLLGALSLDGLASISLADLHFQQALVVPEEKGRVVQLSIAQEPDEAPFQLISLSGNANEEDTLHLSGKVTPPHQSQASSYQQVWEHFDQEIPGPELYDLQERRSIFLGPGYRWIESIRSTESEAVGRLRMPDCLVGTDVDEYQMHPGLIDSCFGLLLTLGDLDAHETFIPFRIRRINFYGNPFSQDLWAHALRLGGKDDVFTGDISLFDAQGKLIFQILGLEGRKTHKDALLKSLSQKRDDWFYDIQWKASMPPAVQPKFTDEVWLYFGEELTDPLYASLKNCGMNCVAVLPGEGMVESEGAYEIGNDLGELLNHLSNQGKYLGGVLYSESSQVESELRGLARFFHLAQAFFSDTSERKIPVLAISRHATDCSSLSQPSGLWGLLRTLNLEHDHLSCKLVDLDVEYSPNDAQIIIDELFQTDGEDRVAWRQEERWVPRLQRCAVQSSEQNIEISSEKTYLVTGGTGALGLDVARWLIDQKAGEVILLSRTGNCSEELLTELQSQETLVRVTKADICDEASMKEVFLGFGDRALGGIVHAAGVLQDGTLGQQTWSDFEKVLNPKVKGAWLLHRLSETMAPDFFVCFSSLASITGSPGQANYVTANHFLNSFASYRKSLGMPGLSIAWGPWQGAGMAAALSTQDQMRLKRRGIYSISPQSAPELFEQLILNPSLPSAMVVAPINWSSFMETFPGVYELPYFEAFQGDRKKGRHQSSAVLIALKEAELVDRPQILNNFLSSCIKDVLGGYAQEIPQRQGIFELGIDSLMAVELKTRLETELECTLPSTLIFDYPTLEAMNRFLLEILDLPSEEVVVDIDERIAKPESSGDDLDGLSEDELKKLLAEELGLVMEVC